MQFIPPFGETGSTPYADRNTSLGVDGSRVPAQFFNDILAELLEVIAAAGLTAAAGDLTQLRQAVQRIAAGMTDAAFQAGWGADGTGADLAVQVYGALTAPRPFSIAGVLANIQAGPVGADLILDIEVEGVSIFTVKPKIADGATVLTAGTLTSAPAAFAVAAGDEIVFKITQIGSTTAGQRLTVTLVAGLPEAPV